MYGEEDDRRYTPEGTAIPQSLWDSYLWSEPQNGFIPEATAIRLADSDDWVTRAWAGLHAYYHGDSETWYAEEDNVPQPDCPEIFGYGENVLNHFLFDRNTKELVFGIELEMESNDEDNSGMLSALNSPIGDQYIVKEDGSLQNGAELVSVPMTLEQHRTHNWERILRNVRSHAAAGTTSTCGFHVHINRRALTPLTVGKMLVMTNSIAPEMVKLLETIAQRSAGHWCQKTKKTLADGRKLDSSHYEILGLTRRGTCELRMFRSNLRSDRVYKNIEFCHALVRYCQATAARYIERADVFLAWLYGKRKDYPALCAFLSEKNLPGWTALTGHDTITETEEA
jgi:hypothetical protein